MSAATFVRFCKITDKVGVNGLQQRRQDGDSHALASFLGADRSYTVPHMWSPKAHCVTAPQSGIEQQVKMPAAPACRAASAPRMPRTRHRSRRDHPSVAQPRAKTRRAIERAGKPKQAGKLSAEPFPTTQFPAQDFGNQKGLTEHKADADHAGRHLLKQLKRPPEKGKIDEREPGDVAPVAPC